MSKQLGDQAETAVCEFLEKRGFKILERNWRTRWCEIDIVAEKQKTVYFVEVKYRSSHDFGDGFEYVTRTKLRQMQFAAEFWISSHNYSGDALLSAAAVDKDLSIDFIEEITI